MIHLVRTQSNNLDFIRLVKALDGELAEKDGSEHTFYSQFNKIDTIRHAVVAYDYDEPVGCGAMKEFTDDTMEIKRMYTTSGARGKGVATMVLNELENWATELAYRKCVLETGKRQPEAIALYKKNGYQAIPNYGQYAGIENSVCFGKGLE